MTLQGTHASSRLSAWPSLPARLSVLLQPCPELSRNSRAFQKVLYLHSVTQATFCPSEHTPSAQLSRNHSPRPVRSPHPTLAHSGFVKSSHFMDLVWLVRTHLS